METSTDRRMLIRHIAQVLVRLNWLGHRRFAMRLLKHNLTPPQFGVLSYLIATPAGCQMHQLAEILVCNPATMTGIVDRMEKAGLVARQYDGVDRRQVLVKSTEQGRVVGEEILLSMRQPAREIFADFDDAELATFAALLSKLVGKLECQETAGLFPNPNGEPA